MVGRLDELGKSPASSPRDNTYWRNRRYACDATPTGERRSGAFKISQSPRQSFQSSQTSKCTLDSRGWFGRIVHFLMSMDRPTGLPNWASAKHQSIPDTAPQPLKIYSAHSPDSDMTKLYDEVATTSCTDACQRTVPAPSYTEKGKCSSDM